MFTSYLYLYKYKVHDTQCGRDKTFVCTQIACGLDMQSPDYDTACPGFYKQNLN